ncbi:hypothetical protein L3V83_11215 [Thiotrichales bacterium 19X7-9]|nr:hypothetical protein [Thiotrichales bacterium 19X7-9]
MASSTKNDFLKVLFCINFIRILSDKELMVEAISCTQPFIEKDGSRLDTKKTKKFLKGKDIYNLHEHMETAGMKLADIVSIDSLKGNFHCDNIKNKDTQKLLIGSAFFQAASNVNEVFIPSESDTDRMSIFNEDDRGKAKEYTKQTGDLYKELNNDDYFKEIVNNANDAISSKKCMQNQMCKISDGANNYKNVMSLENITWYLELTLKNESRNYLSDRKGHFQTALEQIINFGNVDFNTKIGLYNYIFNAYYDPYHSLRKLCERQYNQSSYDIISWEKSLKFIKNSVVLDLKNKPNPANLVRIKGNIGNYRQYPEIDNKIKTLLKEGYFFHFDGCSQTQDELVEKLFKLSAEDDVDKVYIKSRILEKEPLFKPKLTMQISSNGEFICNDRKTPKENLTLPNIVQINEENQNDKVDWSNQTNIKSHIMKSNISEVDNESLKKLLKDGLEKAKKSTGDKTKKIIAEFLINKINRLDQNDIIFNTEMISILKNAARSMSHHTNLFKNRSTESMPEAYQAAKKCFDTVREQFGINNDEWKAVLKDSGEKNDKSYQTYLFFKNSIRNGQIPDNTSLTR